MKPGLWSPPDVRLSELATFPEAPRPKPSACLHHPCSRRIVFVLRWRPETHRHHNKIILLHSNRDTYPPSKTNNNKETERCHHSTLAVTWAPNWLVASPLNFLLILFHPAPWTAPFDENYSISRFSKARPTVLQFQSLLDTANANWCECCWCDSIINLLNIIFFTLVLLCLFNCLRWVFLCVALE